MIVEYYTKSVHAVSSKKIRKKIFGITLINIRLTLNPYPNPESPEFTPTPPRPAGMRAALRRSVHMARP